MEKLEEKDVKIVISSCKKCSGGVRFAVEHTMDKKDFYKEVQKYDLTVNTISLEEYKSKKNTWCEC